MKSISSTRRRACTAIAVAFTLAGCAETQRPQATGKGNIRGINAMVSAPEVTFRIEERSQGQLAFGGGAGVRFDDLSYNVNFDVILAGEDDATRVASRFVDVEADMEYIVSVTGSLSDAATRLWKQPERTWDGSETVFEASFGHLSDSAGRVDIYFAPDGTEPAAGNAVGSINKGSFVPASDFEAGQYRLTLTARDDPDAVIYRSQLLTLAGAVSLTYVVFTADPSTPGTVSVRQLPSSGGSFLLPDRTSPPTIRTYHAAFGTGNYDAYLNGDFSAAVAIDIPFGGLSLDMDAAFGANTVTFTDAGNEGAILLEQELTVNAGTRRSVLLAGAPGDLQVLSLLDDRRPEETLGKLRFVHAASNTDSVDLYVTEPDTDIENIFPALTGIASLSRTPYARFAAQTYDVRVTATGDKTVIAEVLSIDFSSDPIVELILLDTADPNVFSMADWTNPEL